MPQARSIVDPAERRVGALLDDKWRLNRLLGVGGMAAVYAATHRNGARAAIKLFPFSLTTSVDVAARFLREGYLANKVHHPAAVRVLDDRLDVDGELAYLVMELLEGQTLRQRVQSDAPLPRTKAITLMIELCDCLAAAHRAGVIHRDIKPDNLFLTTDGRLKVLDFGMARALDGTGSLATRSGTMLGTPAYMSPEQARGRPSEISPRSDIYSAGATFLFLLTGKTIRDGESAQELLVKAAWTPAEKTKSRCPEIDDDIAAVIDRATAFQPEHRYPSAVEFRGVLENLRASGTESRASITPRAVAPAPDESSPTRRRVSLRRLAWVGLLAATAVVPITALSAKGPSVPDVPDVPDVPASMQTRRDESIVSALKPPPATAQLTTAHRSTAQLEEPLPPSVAPVPRPTSDVAPVPHPIADVAHAPRSIAAARENRREAEHRTATTVGSATQQPPPSTSQDAPLVPVVPAERDVGY